MATEVPGGLLAAFIDVPLALKADFDHWYDTEHLRERREVPGFLSASRFESVDDPEANLILYELAGPDVLTSPAYLEAKKRAVSPLGQRVQSGWRQNTRIVYRLRCARGTQRIDAPYVQTVRLSVKPGSEGDVREWLNAERSVVLLSVPGVRSYHGFESVEGPFHFLNVWGLEDARVSSSAAWNAAKDTPWRDRMAPLWEKTVRRVYRRAWGQGT